MLTQPFAANLIRKEVEKVDLHGGRHRRVHFKPEQKQFQSNFHESMSLSFILFLLSKKESKIHFNFGIPLYSGFRKCGADCLLLCYLTLIRLWLNKQTGRGETITFQASKRAVSHVRYVLSEYFGCKIDGKDQEANFTAVPH